MFAQNVTTARREAQITDVLCLIATIFVKSNLSVT